MEENSTKVEPETVAKIIGKGEKEIFFSSLAAALRAFLEGEISELILNEDTAFFSFSSRGAVIKKQTAREMQECFIQAPVVPLKFFRLSGEPLECSLVSLFKEFKDFFEKKIQDMQIYEQVCHNPESEGLKLYTNYMINLSWDEHDSERIILTLHNVDVKDNHWWRGDFYCQASGKDSFYLIPISPLSGAAHRITGHYSKN